MDAIEAIQRRTSVRRFRPDPVPREVIARLLECALYAPNHKLTEPWRFAVLTGAARERYAEIRARHRLKRWADPASPEAVAGGEATLQHEASEPRPVGVGHGEFLDEDFTGAVDDDLFHWARLWGMRRPRDRAGAGAAMLFDTNSSHGG